MISGGLVRAGETAPVTNSAHQEGHLPPTLLVSIVTREPESLPTASIAMERLLYDLNRRRRLFSEVSAEATDASGATRRLRLDVALHRLGIEQANLRSFWPPITQRELDGARVLFSSQLPVQVEVTLSDQTSGERYAKTAFTVQSTGRTITAGTTDTPGVLIARRIEKYLKEQRKLYAAR